MGRVLIFVNAANELMLREQKGYMVDSDLVDQLAIRHSRFEASNTNHLHRSLIETMAETAYNL
jgi:hypothetical protein